MLDHFAVLDGDAPVHAPGKFHVVGANQRGKARHVHELGKRRKHVIGGFRIEVAGRLVGQQQRRVVDERAGNRHALLLAAGELVGEVVQLGRQARR